MTAQFHEGDKVEVAAIIWPSSSSEWRRGKIIYSPSIFPPRYEVQFQDGTRGVFDAEHIRLSKEQVEQELIKNGERFLDAMGDEVR